MERAIRLLVLLATVLLSTVSVADSHRRPIRSIKAPKGKTLMNRRSLHMNLRMSNPAETVVNYETVTPLVTYRDSNQVPILAMILLEAVKRYVTCLQ